MALSGQKWNEGDQSGSQSSKGVSRGTLLKGAEMLRFRGNSPATVDEKGRLKLPSTFQAELETFAMGEGQGASTHYLTSLDGQSARFYRVAAR